MRCRFGCLFHYCLGISSVLFSQIRPVVQGGVFACGVLLRVFAAFLGVRGFREGQRQEGARSIISVIWGSVHSSDVFTDGGDVIWVLMGKSRFLRTHLRFMDKCARMMAA